MEFIHNGQIDVRLKFVRPLFQLFKDSNGAAPRTGIRTSRDSEAMTSKRLQTEDTAAAIFCQEGAATARRAVLQEPSWQKGVLFWTESLLLDENAKAPGRSP